MLKTVFVVIVTLVCLAFLACVSFYHLCLRIKNKKIHWKVVLLHIFNDEVEESVRKAGLKLVKGSRKDENDGLMFLNRGDVLTVSSSFLKRQLKDAEDRDINSVIETVDCGTDVEKFINEVLNIKGKIKK